LSYGGVRKRLTRLRHQPGGSRPRGGPAHRHLRHRWSITRQSHHDYDAASNRARGWLRKAT